ncbi:alpha-beta hydrolase superfamily lysophospholipase [Nocardia tenerifensis]|uniref:Alpha-beta hydrolase superfamily lysophospholipase n=1 Tax=Nocardia tenerifensis TaxID=228006 RepID=A0A318KC85_9NOCA|nr:lipase family protein [Nocardia tenerifensis]PXX68780.1 alpha-beta hydrolase superfamily lysophospholipase [Nocardia tenerifensis]
MSDGKARTWDVRGIAWWLPGLAVILSGVLLYSPFGVSLIEGRFVVAVAMLLLGASAAARWWMTRTDGEAPRRLVHARRSLGVEAVLAAGFGVLGIAASTMPVSLSLVWVGAFWIALGGCGLLAGARRDDVVVASAALAGWQVLAGAILATLPFRTGLDFTAWTILSLVSTGVAMVVRGVRLTAPLPRLSALRWWRPAAVSVQLIVLAVVAGWYGTVVTQAARQDAEQARLAAFYEVPQGVSPEPPGTVIRSSPMSLPGVNGRGQRILYWSQDRNGAPTVSSGMVWTPLTEGADRPILNFAHGTVSLGAECAPSRQSGIAASMPWLNDALGRGWVVAASDYAGAAGTGDGEHYLVAADQGRDTVNAARAARNLPGTGASTDMLIYGVSQGGLVSLAAAAQSPTYAPELHLVADAATAPASDIAGILRERPPQLLDGWAVVPFLTTQYAKAYPQLDPNALLTPQAAARNHELAEAGCAATPFAALFPRLTVIPGMGDYFKGDPLADPRWRRAFEDNRAPDMSPGTPVYLAQGLDDQLVPPKFTAALVERYCAAGTPVTTQWNPGVGHDNHNEKAVSPRVIQWFAAHLTKTPTPNNCPDPLPTR